MPKKHIKPPPERSTGRILSGADIAPRLNTDDEYPSFRFGMADTRNYCLKDCNTEDLDLVLKTLAEIEKFTWQQLYTTGGRGKNSGGLGFKKVSGKLPNLPAQLSEDVKVYEFRVDQTRRLFGFRNAAILYLLWFDPDHSIFPM